MSGIDHDNPGVRWVRCYLFPTLSRERAGGLERPLRFLQIQPDNEHEARSIRELGHQCDILLCRPEAVDTGAWQQQPIAIGELQIPRSDETYDVVLSGRFDTVTGTPARRLHLAREIARVTRPGGAVLLTLGNRLSPVDLSGGSLVIHSPWKAPLLSMGDVETLFCEENGFSGIRHLSVANHFGWSRVSGIVSLLAPVLDGYLCRISSTPYRWLYSSALNPLLSVWIDRS